MQNFSVCIIAKNEEKNLTECLSRLSVYPFELIVVDTGSTDSTKEIAASFGARIYDFTWCNDFSAARNFSLSKASHDWVLVVDCDEYLEELDFSQLAVLARDYPDCVGQLTRHSICDNGKGEDIVLTDQVERFFNRKYYHYEGIIHEQPVPDNGSKDVLRVFPIPAVFLHVGYEKNSKQLGEKALRNITLLEAALEKNPQDPYLYYQLGESYSLQGDYENAFQAYDKGFYLDVDETLPYVKIMITSYGYSMIYTNRLEQALGLEGVYDAFKQYADFVCMMGNLYLKLQMNEKALEQFLHATTLSDYSVEGANSFIAYHNIACIYEAYGCFPEAIAYYEKAGSYPHSKQRLQALLQRLG